VSTLHRSSLRCEGHNHFVPGRCSNHDTGLCFLPRTCHDRGLYKAQRFVIGFCRRRAVPRSSREVRGVSCPKCSLQVAILVVSAVFRTIRSSPSASLLYCSTAVSERPARAPGPATASILLRRSPRRSAFCSRSCFCHGNRMPSPIRYRTDRDRA